MATTTQPTVGPSMIPVDMEFQELVMEYLKEMPGRVASLRNAFDSHDMPALQRLAHQLKGSAGLYGFPKLGDFAAHLEEQVRAQAPRGRVEDALFAVLESCASTCEHLPSTNSIGMSSC
ncbi:MAG: Hpt domain-containing protein [Pirellulales bacterium]|nr:Hpt domain-containing protein [Pirellulales bacterium]